MFPLPPAWTLSTGLAMEAEIPRLWDTLVPIIGGTTQGYQSSRTNGMLSLPTARTCEEGLPPETGIPRF